MRIDLPEFESWSAVSEKYRAAISARHSVLSDPQLQVQVFSGYAQALWETAQGLARLFSHKKTIAVVDKVEPVFEALVASFSSEGYSLKVLSREEALQPAPSLDPIQSELLFVLYSEDDPITGRLHDNQPLLAALKDKRIFKISVSHSSHAHQSMARPAPFDVRILSLAPDRALLVAGERCRVIPAIASLQAWSAPDADEVEGHLGPMSDEFQQKNKPKILAFEKSLPDGFLPYFQDADSRIFDRAVFYHSEFDGSAVIDRLAKQMDYELPRAGQNSLLDSTSPCRWENPRLADWLLKAGAKEEIVRGLIVISADGIDRITPKDLSRAASEIRAIQSGL
jgi:hypothetical protein